MNKKILDKKRQYLHSLGEVFTAKSGAEYVHLKKNMVECERQFTPFSTTKGNYAKLGTKTKYRKSENEILLLSKTGVFMYKSGKDTKFRRLGWRDVKAPACFGKKTPITTAFLIGRKCEWLLNYMEKYSWLCAVAMTQNFNSLKEFKNFLGFTFLGEQEFLDAFCKTKDRMELCISAKKHLGEKYLPYIAATTTLGFNYFQDIMKMCTELGEKPRWFKSATRVRQFHDELVMKANLSSLEKYSKDVYTYDSKYFEAWVDLGLNVEILDTPRKVAEQGVKQHHCLAFYADSLDNNMFLTFDWQGEKYDMQVNNHGIVQLYGKYNCSPPKELEDIIYAANKRLDGKHPYFSVKVNRSEPTLQRMVMGRPVVANYRGELLEML